jgi:DNA-binding transcriptional MerR regulator
MTQLRVYLVANSESEMMRQQHAVIQYAAGRGWPKPPSEAWGAVANRPGENLADTLAMLSPGDVLLIANVQSLSDKPSEQEAVVRSCLGKGIRIHCLEPMGDIAQYLPGMFAAWASAATVEAELQQALADMEQMEQRHAQDLDDQMHALYEQIMRDGAHFTIGGMNGNGGVDEDMGLAIKSARHKRNLSLRALSELSGVSTSQVHRLEQIGRGEGLEQVLAALNMEQEHASAPTA